MPPSSNRSPNVRNALGRVLDKLGLRDRSRAIAFAYESGLVRPGEER
jgi:DNA-binding CsgD family transcriptional regulator